MVALPATASAAPALATGTGVAVGSWAGRDAVGTPAAGEGADRMASFTDEIVLGKDGGATFTETIDYRFGTSAGERHGSTATSSSARPSRARRRTPTATTRSASSR